MPSSGRGNRWILGLFGLALLVAVGAIALLRPAPTKNGALPAARSSSNDTDAPLLVGADLNPAREAAATQAAAPVPAIVNEPLTSVLRLRVFESETGPPVPDAKCIVYSERDKPPIRVEVVTDSEGRARVEHLPETTILVRVPRSTKNADTTAGLWLPRGTTRDLDIHLVAGGTIVGRVVDDRGVPIEDADVLSIPKGERRRARNSERD